MTFENVNKIKRLARIFSHFQFMLSNINTIGSAEEVKALRTLFEDYLKYVFWSEVTLIPALSHVMEQLNSKDIVATITLHLANTHIHIDRIEKIFESIGIDAEEKKFEPIDSLLREIDIVIDQTQSGAVRDAGLIALLQHVIHSEIATYGTLKSFAITLKEEDIVDLLDKNLEDEKELDLKLSVIAEAYINDEAANKEI
jgi:ferritin-like metal-binding protein YciE